jgi:PhnB protein
LRNSKEQNDRFDEHRDREKTMTDYKLNPYLTVDGAAKAIEFYGKAFGATEAHRMPAQDGKRIMHAELNINGAVIMLADHFPEFCTNGAVTLPTFEAPGAMSVALHFATPPEVDATYRQALDVGGRSAMAPENTFWNARFAVVVDPFGHQWMLNAPLAQ